MVWSTCSIGFPYALWSDVSLSVTGEYSCLATSKRDSSSNARVYTVWVGNTSIFVTFNNTFICCLLLYNHFISEVICSYELFSCIDEKFSSVNRSPTYKMEFHYISVLLHCLFKCDFSCTINYCGFIWWFLFLIHIFMINFGRIEI